MSAVVTPSTALLLSRSQAMAIATCAGKQPFVSRALATRVGNRMRGEGRTRHTKKRSGVTVNPYRCTECGAWHLGGEKKS